MSNKEKLEEIANENKEVEKELDSPRKNDDRIILIDLINHINDKGALDDYDSRLSYLKKNRCLIINYLNKKYLNKKYKVYSPVLAYVFSSNDIKARNLKTKRDFILDSMPYFQTFIEAFKQGENHFKTYYEFSKDVLYGANSEKIVSDIRLAYYHTIHSNIFNGWAGVIGSNPIMITHKNIKNFGFYSGVLSKADEFIKKYPSIFKEFNKKNNIDSSGLLKGISKEKLFKEQNKLIPKVNIDEVFNHFETLTKTTNKNDEFYLTNEKLLIFINATFIECKPIKQNFNCEGFVKKNIRKVFYDFYFKNKNKERNHTKIKRKYFNIMNDAFNGFNENDYTDFSK